MNWLLLGLVGALAAAWLMADTRNAAAATPPAEVALQTESPSPAVQKLYADPRVAARRAVFWLVTTHQNRDGGYTSFSTGANQAPSDFGGTANAILALAAAGYSSELPYSGRVNSPVGYLAANAAQAAEYAAADAGQSALLILALSAAGVDPRSFEGRDLVLILQEQLADADALDALGAYKLSLAILALAAVGESVPQDLVTRLSSFRYENGSWDDGYGNINNADGTANAIMALIAGGVSAEDAVIQDAVAFLRGAQQPQGGWEYTVGWGVNANSTALVIQALSAAGEPWYAADGDWVKDGRTPLETLLSFQGSSGAFQADFGQGPFDDFLATTQGILGVTGRPLPLPAYSEATRRGLICLAGLQDPATGAWEQFGGFGAGAGGTARAILAIAAAGGDPYAETWATADGLSAVGALERDTASFLTSGRGGRVGLVLQAAAAAGAPADVGDFAGQDLPLLVSSYLSPTGQYDDTAFGIFDQAEAMLGLLSSGAEVAPESVEFLLNAQTGGDWGNSDSNGQALQVLGALGRRAPVATLAVLRRSQSEEGGWRYGDVFNASSSAEVALGLLGVGLNPFGPEWSVVVDGRLTNVADAVMALQMENGCWASPYAEGSDPFSTTDALMLLSARPTWGSAATLAPSYGPGN